MTHATAPSARRNLLRLWRLCSCAAIAFAACLCPAAVAFPPDPAREARRLAEAEQWPQAEAHFRALAEANPQNPSFRAGLADALYRQKRYDEAIEQWQACIDAGGSGWVNLFAIACGHALSGRKQEALDALEASLAAGLPDQQVLESDTDLDSLRDDPRFIAMTGLNPPPGLDRDAQWRYDLDFFARRMAQMHWDLYANVPKERFEAEVDRLKADVPGLKDHQVVMRLAKIVASVGDGHTVLRLTADDQVASLPVLPVRFYLFSDGLHVVAAAPPNEALTGAKVVRFGSLSAEEAFEAAKAYQSIDNEMGYVDGVPLRLRLPWVLEAIGATDDPARVTLDVVLADGTSQTVELEAAPAGPPNHVPDLRPRGEEQAANHAATAELPLYLQQRDAPIWREHLPANKLVYVHFGAIANPPGTTLGAFFEELADFVDQRDDAEYVVLDMRFNGGGNTGLVLPMVHALIRSEELRIPGRLFVITGRRTFSAAMNTTSLLEIHTPATFVGEPTGSRPNFVGESTWLVLPYHKNRVFCSSRYWQFMSSTDERKWIAPQLPATLSSQDFARNRDPAMEVVLAAIAAGWPEGSPPPPAESAGRARVPTDD